MDLCSALRKKEQENPPFLDQCDLIIEPNLAFLCPHRKRRSIILQLQDIQAESNEDRHHDPESTLYSPISISDTFFVLAPPKKQNRKSLYYKDGVQVEEVQKVCQKKTEIK